MPHKVMSELPRIKAIIADTDESFIRDLQSLLAELRPDLKICGTAASGPKALGLVRKLKPDVAFLEVRIPGMCGMKVAREISGSCGVVFLTAHDHYAVNAFDSGAVDYLVKPFAPHRLEKALKRVERRLALDSNSSLSLSQAVERLTDSVLPKKSHDYLQWVRVQKADSVRLIPVDQVCYFQAGDKYTLVVTREGQSLIKAPIKRLAEELDPNRYWRIHRATIVNVAQIERVSRSVTGRGAVRLKDRPEVLTVSRPYLYIFKQM